MSDGGPAFPSVTTINVPKSEPGHFSNTTVKGGSVGMSLRDYFAAAALDALIITSRPDSTVQADVEDAYLYADAMLDEREKERP